VRTTVDIPDPTYRKLKSKAAQQGCPVKELILSGVERELRAGVRRRGRVRPPLVRSKEPGTLDLTNEQIYEIIPFP
jgi:hypothetical protein